jgi:hypothetical protein
MFDQNLAHAAGDQLSVRCQKHAKSDSQMSALKPSQRAILVTALGVVAGSFHLWVARADPAISFLPRERGADWIVFPAAVDARAHWYAGLDATVRRQFTLPRQPVTARFECSRDAPRGSESKRRFSAASRKW